MHKKAENHYRETLRLSKKIDDQGERRLAEAKAKGNIGLVYQDLGQPTEALKYMSEALAIFKRIGAQTQIGIVTRNIERIQKSSIQNTVEKRKQQENPALGKK